MTVIVLLGAPGAGKGTQATILSEQLGIPHVATGDLFRAAVRDGTPLGVQARRYMDAGQLVPDDITIRLLGDRLEQPDTANGLILDGFPRTRAQAEVLDAALAELGRLVGHALYIDVPTDDLVRRMAGRRICQANGHPYNVVTNPPEQDNRCDLDGSPLIQRPDDSEETVRQRMHDQVPPLMEVVDHYRTSGVLRTVDGRRDIDEVAASLLAAIGPDATAGTGAATA